MSLAAPPFHLSTHALERMDEMGLDTDDVSDVLREPDLTYPQSSQRYKDQTVFVRGGVGVVVSPDGVIVTVIWHRATKR